MPVARLRSTHPRTPTALLRLALAAALLAAATAPAAGATELASSWRGFEGGPALASDGRVIIGERRGEGALRILAIDPRTHAAAVVGAFPAIAAGTFPVLKLSGTGGIVTASLDTFDQVGVTDAEQPQPIARDAHTWTILPSLAPLASCAPAASAFPRLDAAGGDDFVATVGDDCGANTSAVKIRTVNGVLTIPVQRGPADGTFAPQISNLRASGPMVAWLETRLASVGSPLTISAVVARGKTGEVLLRAALGTVLNLGMGLGSDGTVAVNVSITPCVMGVVSPAAPVLRTIALPPSLCANLGGESRGQGAIAVAGGQIVYATYSGYAVVDLHGAAHALADARLRPGRTAPVAFDGRTVFAVRSDCDADRLLAVDAGVRATSAPADTTADPCPLRRSGPGRLRIARDGRVTIALRCTNGCRGTLRLVQQRRGGRERLVGEADYGSAANPVLVRPRIARYARALAGCSGGLRLVARLHPVGDDQTSAGAGRGKGLGAYRIGSRARCRHSGGPPFTAPQPGPRP